MNDSQLIHLWSAIFIGSLTFFACLVSLARAYARLADRVVELEYELERVRQQK